MEYFAVMLRRLWRTRTITLVMVVGMIVSVVLGIQNFELSSRFTRNSEIHEPWQRNMLGGFTMSSSMRVGKFSLLSDASNSTYPSVAISVKPPAETSLEEVNQNVEDKALDGNLDDNADGDDSSYDTDLDEDEVSEEEFLFDVGDGTILKKVTDPIDGFAKLEKFKKPKEEIVEEQGNNLSYVSYVPDGISKLNSTVVIEEINPADKQPVALPTETELDNNTISLSRQHAILPKNNMSLVLPKELRTGPNNPAQSNTVPVRKKKQGLPPVYISEMNQLLLRNRASYHAMRPRWSSVRDQQILDVKAQIENAPIVRGDQQLYEPAFRNISMFIRSYELMDRTLKVYVYKEGSKPIFHQPLLKGLYASEGWFMKLMEGNKQFVVKDPRKAHLFYMPFSSRLLQFALYVRNSHNRTNLRLFLEKYVDTIASKYRFWNRTGGADHFLVACHDWAAYETRHGMGRCIRSLCNADLHDSFKLGKDVSLPETYVRSSANPLRDLGGRPPNKRPILAFFAGNMHGRLRPILLQHWENKDPNMKILGPMPAGRNNLTSKLNYIQHMKRSKYCICPRGYEVNSPRIVEAFFYECVPVIISDNYVPPFFEILNWEAFSVIIPEKDVPRLKEILLSIPEEKYLALQKGVRKVQQHFLWHSKPVKYDLFHMILHNIWFNRVYQVRKR